MRDDDHDVTLRPAKIRSRRAPPTSFFTQVLRAVSKQTGGRLSAGANRNAVAPGRSTFGRVSNVHGRSLFSPNSRRVAIKARIVRHRGIAFRSASMAKHIVYLQREGVAKDKDRAVMFDADGEPSNERAFVERCAGDRHHFRFIVAPEDAAEMTDLRVFARDLARQMETDLGTKLDWVAVDHWNTDNPHIHLLVRSVDDAGADLICQSTLNWETDSLLMQSRRRLSLVSLWNQFNDDISATICFCSARVSGRKCCDRGYENDHKGAVSCFGRAMPGLRCDFGACS